MRVLFFGVAGVKKYEFVNAVRTLACAENVKPGGSSDTKRSAKFLQLYDVDKEIEKKKGGYPYYGQYLDDPDPEDQQALWNETVSEIIGNIEEESPTNVFVLMHGVYLRSMGYFSRLNFELLRKLRPTAVVTLIDDAYDVATRILKRETDMPMGSRCSISQAIQWRTVETMMADIVWYNVYSPHPQADSLAEKIFPKAFPHFVVSAKHPSVMLYRLLFERRRLVLYASYPITYTRANDSFIAEINEHRRNLHKDYTVFDPVTIDEYPVVTAGDGKQFIKRWPYSVEESQKDYMDGVSKLTIDGILKDEDEILANIEGRDFRLVNQAQGIVAYRPYWGSRESPSTGVDREMLQAYTRNRPIYVVHDESKDGPLPARKKTFEPISKAMAFGKSSTDILSSLAKWQKENEKRFQEQSMLPTWELPESKV
jgi:adenylate kinase